MRHRALIHPVVATLLFLLACWQFTSVIDDRPMHRDEARWIHRATYIRELLHPLSDYWDEKTWISRGGTLDERYRLRAQPPMGSYVMGLGFLLQGQALPDIGFWNMDRDDAWNLEQGNQPFAADVHTARRTSAIIGALTVVLVYFIASLLTNPVGGMIAGIFLTLHPLMIHLATFAGSDAVLGLSIVLAAVAASRLADRPSWPRAILLGAILGLGASTKLSPLGVTAPLALLGAIAMVYQLLLGRQARRDGPASTRDEPPSWPSWRLSLGLLSTPIVALITFIVSYPYLWRDPIGHIHALIDYRQWGMDIQGRLWSHIAVETRTEALERVGTRLGDEWTVLGRAREAAGWSRTPDGLELALAAAGLVILLWLAAQRGLWSAPALIAAVLTGQAAITVYGLGVDWARYHLPILLLVAVCIGVLGGAAWTELGRLLRSRQYNQESRYELPPPPDSAADLHSS